MVLKIANAAGFLGDWLDAPRRLVERERVDYLTLEYLAELTMSLLARQREKNPQAGFADDFLTVLESLLPALQTQPKLKIVTNAGGVNPQACSRAAAKLLARQGLEQTTIGVVTGDDLLPRLDALIDAGCEFRHFDTQEPLGALRSRVVSANAYLGARPIADALAAGARIVITGRVADASLTVGPAMHEFAWSWDDWPRLAAATVAGHLIECGAQVTGGYATEWPEIDLADVGYPIAELSAAGDVVITKPVGSGGSVNRRTVTEQLVYEIGDPRCYHTPDIDVDFTAVRIDDLGHDRVRVTDAMGKPPSDQYKVSLAYRDGYFASGQLLVAGADCIAKAERCAEIIFRRVALAGHRLDESQVELLGAGAAIPRGLPNVVETLRVPLESREESDGTRSVPMTCSPSPPEVMLRITARAANKEALESFARQFAPLITSGPAGLAGYSAGRPQVRPVFAYWPTLIPKNMVQPRLEVRRAEEWSAMS